MSWHTVCKRLIIHSCEDIACHHLLQAKATIPNAPQLPDLRQRVCDEGSRIVLVINMPGPYRVIPAERGIPEATLGLSSEVLGLRPSVDAVQYVTRKAACPLSSIL
jgi:hypothetical protein